MLSGLPIPLSWRSTLFSASLSLLIIGTALSGRIANAQEPQNGTSSSISPEFFETHVRPLLAKHCYECHSRKEGPDNGALVLESITGITKGGSRGPLFQSDHPDSGLFLKSIRYEDPELQMPPAGKLSESDLRTLETWIAGGAPLPEYKEDDQPLASTGIDLATARQFWSFQPLRQTPVPTTNDSEWPRTAIDQFLLAEMNRQNLAPSPEAERSTLLRRLSFDVTGLPPTPEELNHFETNTSPTAFEEEVDRLLASPHYGERWARVWLDLARYTDFTPDWQSPTDRGWIYRDWVVSFLNENRPYDEFLRLQLAADLQPETDPKDLAALGFIGLSPTYWKELRLAPSVIEQIVADEWDERLDAASRTWLGLTVTCARCHDHKFDPITMKDYYALAGVLASTQLHERPLLPEAEATTVLAAQKQVRELDAKLKTLREQKSPEAAQVEQQINEIRNNTPHIDTPSAHVLREASIYVLPEGDELTRLEYRENQSRDLPIFQRGNPSNPGTTVPRQYIEVLSPETPQPFTQGSGRAELAEAMLKNSPGLLARVFVNRIWAQHFGAGLVRTPSDFGTQGDRPTHPELLEYLSYEFVSRGWNIKWLHREILTSAAWRQSSQYRSDGEQLDPDNRFLWRMNRRRLDIEMWRDAILAANGRLNLTMGGPSQAIDDPANVRRTIYVTVAREELHHMLRMYDFPEASAHSPKREPTTTPLQQLFVLNSPWMQEQATALYQKISMPPVPDTPSVSDGTIAGAIRATYRNLFSRWPTDEELAVGITYLTGGVEPAATLNSEVPVEKWTEYLQALLGINELYFVD
ncbi:MAG: PSD1 domain-containing protein [Planctomyces sp.]|nr:PSD1 domain-containing protein [Planctomyces sp.]